MSAIIGFINLNGENINEAIGNDMVEKLNIYKLDSIKTMKKNNVFMACGMEYVTPESVNEVLPYYDEENKIMITADAIIDNRDELFKLLNMDNRQISDSQLILKAYLKWGKECPKKLVGDFSFVIWDENKKEVFVVRDHVAKRSLYYYFKNNIFGFSTVIKPLLSLMDEKPKFNEQWITEYLSLKGVVHEMQFEDTLYKDIKQVQGATYISLKDNKLIEEKYWDPINEVKPLKLSSEEEYHKAFLKVYDEAVKCRLRCIGDVAISLSGGLDSSSVAALAAKELKKENKRLKGFSSVPLKEFDGNVSRGRIADESDYIEELRKMYPNIDIEYCRCENKNSLTDIEYFNEVLEQPHKIIENLYWIDNILKKAKENNCRILLNGQSGNYTVSYGNFTTFLYTLYKNRQFIRMGKEIRAFKNVNKIPTKFIIRGVGRMIIPYKIRAFNDRNYQKEFIYKNIPVNLKLAEKYNIEEKLNSVASSNITMKCSDINETRKEILNSMNFIQVSTMETKLGLANGIVERDPTRDKRVIEFCLSVPFDEFVKNGQERYLIRGSMKGILPEKIRTNVKVRGLQGADWVKRLEGNFDNIKNDIKYLLKDENINKYLNINKIKNYIETFDEDIENKRYDKLRMLIVVIIFSNFIKENAMYS